MSPSEPTIAYTDGGCAPNPGPGGWGVLLIDGDAETELYGGTAEVTTNNRMEITAALRALSASPSDRPLIVYADSRYVIDGITSWVKGWVARGWRASGGKPVVNADLWRELLAATEGRDITWEWVRGHDGDAGNERADELATAGREHAKENSDDC